MISAVRQVRLRWTQASAGFFHSIRFRLTVWFALVLGLVLLVFGSLVYYMELKAVQSQAVVRLELRMREVSDLFRRALRDYDNSGSAGVLSFAASAPFLNEREVLILIDASGQTAAGRGPIDAQTALQVARQSVELASRVGPPGSSSSRSFQYSLARLPDNASSPSAGEQPGWLPDWFPGQQPNTSLYLFQTLRLGYDTRLLGWVILGQPVDPGGQLPRLLWGLSLASLITLVFALAGGYWLADRTLWPVKAITRTAQDISESDLNRRIKLTSQDELGELARTFDRMLERLQAAFNRQRQFTADASHELRTPLTIIGLETDRALTGQRTPEEYQRALRVIQSENEFMTRLVSKLLTLARMDAGQVQLKHELIDLSDLALEVLERYSPIAARRGVELRTGELPELILHGDRQSLVQMIGNLVENAIKFSPPGPGQWVQVETGERFAPQSADGSLDRAGKPLAVWVRVSDNGPGIAPDHLPHLFDRFYRGDPARSHNTEETGWQPAKDASQAEPAGQEITPGSGLGLSIVQWIAQVHNGQVTVTSQPGEGSVFEVELPVDSSKTAR